MRVPKPIQSDASNSVLLGHEELYPAATAATLDAHPVDHPVSPRIDPDEFGPDPAQARSRRLSWAELMRRVFAIDVLDCPRCHGRLRILSTIHPPRTTRAILECLDLPARAPPADAARPEDDRDIPSDGCLDFCQLD